MDEYKLSNLRGTIAFARTSARNSATDQFFFNTADNPSLNTQNGGFTVFGEIVGVQGISGVSQAASLAVMDTMNADPVYDGGSPFDSLPLLNYTAGTPVKPANFVYVNSVTHVKPKAGIPATPVFSIGSGTYKGPQTVTLTEATPNAKIYYYLFQAASKDPGSIYGAIHGIEEPTRGRLCGCARISQDQLFELRSFQHHGTVITREFQGHSGGGHVQPVHPPASPRYTSPAANGMDMPDSPAIAVIRVSRPSCRRSNPPRAALACPG